MSLAITTAGGLEWSPWSDAPITTEAEAHAWIAALPQAEGRPWRMPTLGERCRAGKLRSINDDCARGWDTGRQGPGMLPGYAIACRDLPKALDDAEPCNPLLFTATAARIGKLVTEKNAAYGDAAAKSAAILSQLYPAGIAPEQYTNALLIVRILDKLCRIAAGNDGAFGESAWTDIAGYGVLGATRKERGGK